MFSRERDPSASMRGTGRFAGFARRRRRNGGDASVYNLLSKVHHPADVRISHGVGIGAFQFFCFVENRNAFRTLFTHSDQFPPVQLNGFDVVARRRRRSDQIMAFGILENDSAVVEFLAAIQKAETFGALGRGRPGVAFRQVATRIRGKEIPVSLDAIVLSSRIEMVYLDVFLKFEIPHAIGAPLAEVPNQLAEHLAVLLPGNRSRRKRRRSSMDPARLFKFRFV